MSESRNAGTPSALTSAPESEPIADPIPFDLETTELSGFQLVELERQSSFFMTGGLAAAHAAGRDRSSIWSALERREVYATSGPRILLWFDLLNSPDSAQHSPMGSAVRMSDAPVFEVRAVGSFEQGPGCPEESAGALGPERLAHLCKGECYNPTDRRRAITRIEVVRIAPQQSRGEGVGPLIQDPWRVFECDGDPAGCTARFTDADYPAGGRDVLYYARAVEEKGLAVNAGSLRCEYDAKGECVSVNRCGTPATADSDCLAETEERAWSSPIFVDWPTAGG